MKSLYGIIIFVLALYFMSCAPAPIKINFDPQPNLTELSLGAGKRISLFVFDDRQIKNFGNIFPERPPFPQPPPITSDQNISEVFKNKISDGLRKKGFEISHVAERRHADLIVEILRLKILASGNFRQGGRNLGNGNLAVLTLLSKCKNSSKPYGNTFHKEAFGEQGLFKNVTISELFNTLISEGLERILQDVELLQCLKTA